MTGLIDGVSTVWTMEVTDTGALGVHGYKDKKELIESLLRRLLSRSADPKADGKVLMEHFKAKVEEWSGFLVEEEEE